MKAQWIVIIFYKLQYFIQNGPTTQLGAFSSAWIHKTYHSKISTSSCRYKSLQKYLCQLNRTIPKEIWPLEDILAPWDKDVPLTPYQEQLKEALVEYQTNIPYPKEWSQEYPMYYSQATQDTSAWKDIQEDISSWKDVYKMTKTPIIPIHDMTPPNDLERRIEQLELRCYRAREEKKRKAVELNITSDISTDYDTDDN
ncbi:hypothetical protein Golob_012775 [Gossypium lobatum]|uniref:Uncharacterized protein n=1 Tax=Gossypium lobatum TaxID=34289 RepID=A0A7J8LMD5_9ROSI|nr:hypothetical protein [Gossypium lobatum]